MRISVSNLASEAGDDPTFVQLLVDAGIEGVELAPTKVWARPEEVSREEAAAARSGWGDRGLDVAAFQSLVFDHPELKLFGTEQERGGLQQHLQKIIDLGSWMGATALVFGSPKNRARGTLPIEAARETAVSFFSALGGYAAERGTCLCIEPNPPEYGCDFVTNVAEGRELVEAVSSPGFRLNLDAGGMAMNGEAASEISGALAAARHFHASEPRLVPPSNASSTPHEAFAHELSSGGYEGWVSLEMLPAAPSEIQEAIAFVKATYG